MICHCVVLVPLGWRAGHASRGVARSQSFPGTKPCSKRGDRACQLLHPGQHAQHRTKGQGSRRVVMQQRAVSRQWHRAGHLSLAAPRASTESVVASCPMSAAPCSASHSSQTTSLTPSRQPAWRWLGPTHEQVPADCVHERLPVLVLLTLALHRQLTRASRYRSWDDTCKI